MNMEPFWESHNNPDMTGHAISIPIDTATGKLTLRAERATGETSTRDDMRQWSIGYTLVIEDIERQEILGYAATYHDSVRALKRYLQSIDDLAAQSTGPAEMMDLLGALDETHPPGLALVPR